MVKKMHNMEKIASFTVDHTVLKRGIYISRVDGDITTYDIRAKIPNGGDYLDIKAAHTLEHLFATYFRNSEIKDDVIYFGPMGCRTGFYLLIRNAQHKKVIELINNALQFTVEFEGKIPGVSEVECGNYLEHDLEKAKQICKELIPIYKNHTEDMLYY